MHGVTEQEQLEFLYQEIRRLDNEIGSLHSINDQLIEEINRLYSTIDSNGYGISDEVWLLKQELHRHTCGFHSMLIACNKEKSENESNIP